MVSRVRLFVLFVSLALWVGLARPAAGQPHERTVRDTLRPDVTTLSVDAEEGSVALSPWDRDAVAYRARIVSAQAQDVVERTRIQVDTTADQLRIATDHSAIEMRWRFGPELIGYGTVHPRVHYTIKVPRSLNATVDGEASRVQVEGLAGELQIDAEGGPQDLDAIVGDLLPSEADPEAPTVTVRGQRGPARIDVEEGPVAVADMQGNLSVTLEEGALTVDGHRGGLALEVEEGQAEAQVNTLRETLLATDEGRIALTMPQDAGFRLSTDLGDGATLEAPFDLAPLRDEAGNYRGAVHGGGPLLRVASSDGAVTLRTQ
jgi:hypothetical protein